MLRTEAVNVLIVDDDRSTQRVLSDALTRQGFVVTVERDGEWAVQTFEKKYFDAVILDVLLPAISGFEVAKRIRAIPKGLHTPIVMISGVYKSVIHQREAVEKHGAFAFLEKPLDLAQLTDTLKAALGERYPRPPPPVPPPPPLDDVESGGSLLTDPLQREEVEVVESQAKRAATLRHQGGPAVRGDLASRPFAELLAELYRWRATGALLLRRDKVKKIVYFRSGTPEVVKSNLLVECLGRILVREKMISEAECTESLERSKASGRMQGTTLIEMGCISPHNLQYALHTQLQEKLFDAFRWEAGEYQFNPDAPPPSEPISLGVSTAQLIYEGIKRTYDEPRLTQVMAGTHAKFVHPVEEPLYALQDAGLDNDERELLALADGHKTVATLRAVDVLPPLDAERLLYAMKCAQMITFRDNPAEGRPRAPSAKVADPAPGAAPPAVPSPWGQAQPPPLPPPLPRHSSGPPVPGAAAEPPLPLPWEDAKLSAPLAPAPASSDEVRPQGTVSARAEGSLLPELSGIVPVGNLSSEEGAVRERLAIKAETMRRLDYFQVLRVKPTASREEIKRAYFTLAREYHPDRHFHSASAEVRALAQQIYDLISTAHDTLADPTERERYVAELAAGVKREVREDVTKILAAEGKFQTGEEAMRSNDYAAAYKHFSDAIALYSDEGEFHAWQGWALFHLRPTQVDGAIETIERAISLNPKLDKSYLFLGYIHKAGGRPDKAERQFEKAIQCNPDCTEALRELRLLGKGRR